MGRIHSIETFGGIDGPGIRVVVFFQGCALRCLYCHNPDTWDPTEGQEITAEELVREIKKYKNFIKNGGVTLSGGEPLLQHRFAKEIISLCKENNLHTAIDTSGCVPLSKCSDVIEETDLIILDIKSIYDPMSIDLTTKNSQNSKELLAYCESINKDVWVRQVILPGWTDDIEYIHNLGGYLKGFGCVKKVELLGFHKTGEYKWQEIGLEYTLYDTPVPEEKCMQNLRGILRSYGLTVN